MSKEGGKEGATSRTPPRERIIDAARDLFRKHGLRGVGVDAIAEAAGTNKMTLYRSRTGQEVIETNGDPCWDSEDGFQASRDQIMCAE